MASSSNEWSNLRSVIVGRAKGSIFPYENEKVTHSIMYQEFFHEFKPHNPFPEYILQAADRELDQLGIKVQRARDVDWNKVGGYTGSMARDGLMVVGNHVIEAPYSWSCRKQEIELAFGHILADLEKDPRVRVFRARFPEGRDTIYDDDSEGSESPFAINNSRPAFDTADFIRVGNTIVGQLSHVTNPAGVDYLRERLPEGYNVQIVETKDPTAMHIDTTLLALRKGLLLYHPIKCTYESLSSYDVFKGWEILPFPIMPKHRTEPPLFMASAWLIMNVLSLGNGKVIIEENDTEFGEWLKARGMEPIYCPFRHVHSIGGSFHCATVDLIREDDDQLASDTTTAAAATSNGLIRRHLNRVRSIFRLLEAWVIRGYRS
ncbi:hypothetical protein B9Z19DRAFT_1099556 [Tuber borchii]|uniref:Glycine amidinotransferase, mitochondrial n=1 Tax=Tuber borchii TaxID=42251 RepID=A0A2T7A1W5_TUBBO|nr:hypothetical protein B9Z19DRAFT_1099556 [Tuber borchii]